MATGKVAWQHNIGSTVNVSDIFNLSDGRIGVANGDEILALDPKDGTDMNRLVDNGHWRGTVKVAISSYGNQNKLAVLHQTLASDPIQMICYELAFEPLPSNGKNCRI